jgi:hypothetical protein
MEAASEVRLLAGEGGLQGNSEEEGVSKAARSSWMVRRNAVEASKHTLSPSPIRRSSCLAESSVVSRSLPHLARPTHCSAFAPTALKRHEGT